MNHRQLDYKSYIFSAGVIVNDAMYFFSEKENVLMEMNMDNWEMRYSSKFRDYSLYSHERTDALCAIDSRIFKLPLKGNYIEEFSLEDSKYHRVLIGNYNKKWANFVGFEVQGNFLYIFPKWERRIIRIDSRNYKVEKIELFKTIDKNVNKKNFVGFSTIYRENSQIWLFEKDSQRVNKYDMDKGTLVYYNLPIIIGECVDAYKVKGIFYLLTKYGRVYIWDYDADKYSLFWEEKQYLNIDRYFGKIVVIQQKIILLPCFGDKIKIIAGKWGEEKCPEDFHYMNLKWGKYVRPYEDKNNYYYPMRMCNYILTIDKEKGEIHWKKAILPLYKEKLYCWQLKVTNCFSILTDDLGGIEFLLDLLEVQFFKEEYTKKKLKMGDVIWRKLRN